MNNLIEFIPINNDPKFTPHPLEYKTVLSSGIDVPALLVDVKGEKYKITLLPGERKAIPTGYCCKLNPNYELQIRPRSGLALKHGITVLNSPATIDADYEGHIMVILINLDNDYEYTINDGDRIAQFVVAPIERELNYVNFKSDLRGENGFGSTGK